MWPRWGKGIAIGTGVSQWNDATPNANHLVQATGGAQPVLQADGSILFNGSSQYLKASAFTLNMPETVYLAFKQVSWTLTGTAFDGNTMNSMRLYQGNGGSGSPELDIFAGTAGPITMAALLGTYAAVAAVYNGTSSLLQVNQGPPATAAGNVSGNGAGFTLGAHGGNLQFGNIQAREAIAFAGAHNAYVRTRIVIRYLRQACRI